MLSKEKAMDGVRLFVFDMDGTVYLGDQPIEGSIEFIREVEAAKDRDYIFFTNNASKVSAVYVEKLRKIRFLRKLGLSLDEIKSAVVSDETAAEMIRGKSAELSAEMAALDDRIRMLHVVLAAAEKGAHIYDAEKKLHQPVDDPENLRIAETVTRLLAERRFAELPQYAMKSTSAKPCRR